MVRSGLAQAGALQRGRELADVGAQRALDGAQAETDGAFRSEALHFMAAFAEARFPAAVTAPEVRMAARERGSVREIREPRAWGPISVDLRRRGWLEPAGYAPSPDPTSHARPCRAWRWTGKKGLP